jgi:hypothetical protein
VPKSKSIFQRKTKSLHFPDANLSYHAPMLPAQFTFMSQINSQNPTYPIPEMGNFKINFNE